MQDEEVLAEFNMSKVDSVFAGDDGGAYFVQSVRVQKEGQDVKFAKWVYELQVIDGVYQMIKICQLDSLSLSHIKVFYLMKDEQYGIAIYANGIIEYFEYITEEENWEDRVGTQQNLEDIFYYARSDKFYA